MVRALSCPKEMIVDESIKYESKINQLIERQKSNKKKKKSNVEVSYKKYMSQNNYNEANSNKNI